MSYSPQAARDLALQVLEFMGQNTDLSAAFLAGSGLRAQDLRAAASDSGFALSLLDFLCEDDSRVLAFAQFAAIAPDRVMAARMVLAGPGSHGWDPV